MQDTRRHHIVVGIETSACDAVLRAAADQVRSRQCGVHLVHVMSPAYAGAPEVAELTRIAAELHDEADRLLLEVASRLERLLDHDLPVTTEIAHGAVVPSLVAASDGAELVVVGQRREARHGHAPRLTLVPGVVARSHAPVLVVPETWQAQITGEPPS